MDNDPARLGFTHIRLYQSTARSKGWTPSFPSELTVSEAGVFQLNFIVPTKHYRCGGPKCQSWRCNGLTLDSVDAVLGYSARHCGNLVSPHHRLDPSPHPIPPTQGVCRSHSVGLDEARERCSIEEGLLQTVLDLSHTFLSFPGIRVTARTGTKTRIAYLLGTCTFLVHMLSLSSC